MNTLVKVPQQPARRGEYQNLRETPGLDARFVEMFPIILCCPVCGKLCSVSTRVHAVTFHEDGTFSASPSFVCPHPPCTWHVFINRCEY